MSANAMNKLSSEELLNEFDRQVQTLVDVGYPTLAKKPKASFLKCVLPLREKVTALNPPKLNLETGKLPFVIVIKNELVPSEVMMSHTEKNHKNGVTILRPHTTENFKTIPEVTVPEGLAYLLVDIDRGKESINLPPNKARSLIMKARRTTLTIDEGIAIVTQFPDFLMKNNCFSLLASRTGSDQRVPAIWINAKKEPNLGWCWDGNPHTWLGSASAKHRV